LKETVESIALMLVILGTSWFFTEWFTRKMYYRCRNCITINAKRRIHCRKCGHPLP
jgi:rRNA maturation endonuclease Nob1